MGRQEAKVPRTLHDSAFQCTSGLKTECIWTFFNSHLSWPKETQKGAPALNTLSWPTFCFKRCFKLLCFPESCACCLYLVPVREHKGQEPREPNDVISSSSCVYPALKVRKGLDVHGRPRQGGTWHSSPGVRESGQSREPECK